MSKEPYKIVNATTSWTSKLGSGAVALGSVATAIVITVPGLPGYEFLDQNQGEQPQSDLAQSVDQELVNGVVAMAATAENTSVNSETALTSSSPNSSLTVNSETDVSPKPKTQSEAPILALPGIDSGNTSSATPYGSEGASASNASGSTNTGNTSSPTPAGGEYDDDDDDYEYDDDDDDDYDDDEEDDDYEDDEDDD